MRSQCCRQMATRDKRYRPNLYRRGAPTREPYEYCFDCLRGREDRAQLFSWHDCNLQAQQCQRHNRCSWAAPQTILQHARERLADFERVYCVFDGDTDQVKAAVGEIASSPEGRAGKWHSIVSTPCFEVWLCLHFQYATSPIGSGGGKSAGDATVKALKAHLPGYKKGDSGIFQLLHDRLPRALANAKKLERHNASTRSSNPATAVHLLVDYLCKLKPPMINEASANRLKQALKASTMGKPRWPLRSLSMRYSTARPSG